MDHDNIEVSDAGAERLVRLAEGLTDDQVDALLGAAEAREDGSISRREFAQAAGALGVGSLLGGGGVGAMTETAAADASTTDEDWNVGGPNNRGDIFADGLDAISVSTEQSTIAGVSDPFVSRADGLNDISVTVQQQSPTAETDYTALDVSDGPKAARIHFSGGILKSQTGNLQHIGPIVVDGTTNDDYPTNQNYASQDEVGNEFASFDGYPLIYDSSLTVKWRHNGDGNRSSVIVQRKGSGPHTAAVVKDGESAYQIHDNVGRIDSDTVDFWAYMDNFSIPNGYEIVKNPPLDGVDPFSAVWDADKQEFVQE
jgi:hypothetical protein